MIGSRDMAFPRLNALRYWIFLFSGIFLYSSVLVGQCPIAGGSPTRRSRSCSSRPALNMDFYALALLFLTISTTVGAVNFIVTPSRCARRGCRSTGCR